ncbi:MAG TPA: hypothetical protein VFU50_06425 [Terriglobales bacterium]|nr:hypothetical protein [Terriglobales bacterium]
MDFKTYASIVLSSGGDATGSPAATTVAAIVGVLAATGVLIWVFGAWSEQPNALNETRFRRRILVSGALLYGGAALYAVILVVAGSEPVQSLLGLPISALLVWFFLRAALGTKVPKDVSNRRDATSNLEK